jgi:hypothetical protein
VIETAAHIKLPHAHRILERLSRPVHPGVLVRSTNRYDVQVNLRGKPPVQAHLLATAMEALLEGGEIQEPEVDRFFDLVGVIAGEQDPGDMGFDEINV